MSTDNGLCFVIMSFADDNTLKDSYEYGIKQTVKGLGYRCERVDEQHFNGSIRERILQNLHEADFIIVDLTQARPNCYYELGMAHAMGKEVIHIVNKDNQNKDIHFDVQDFNIIPYNGISDLANKLQARLKDTLKKLKRHILHLTQHLEQNVEAERGVFDRLSQNIITEKMTLEDSDQLHSALEKADVVLYSCTSTPETHAQASLLIRFLRQLRHPPKLVVYAQEELENQTFQMLTGFNSASVSKMPDALLGRLKNSLQ